jgi:hypothetical protein
MPFPFCPTESKTNIAARAAWLGISVEQLRILEFYDSYKSLDRFAISVILESVVNFLLVSLGFKRGQDLLTKHVRIALNEQQKRTIVVKALHRPVSLIPKSLRPNKIYSWR